jgi:hypothetical protein
MAAGGTAAAAQQAWVVYEDESGSSLRPPKARTWGRRGHTPVVRVPGRRAGTVSTAALVCYRPGTGRECCGASTCGATRVTADLKRLQCHPEVINGCLAATGLTITAITN